jgi:formylglycine-generating enzyme required for sulfatase activity
VGAEKLANGVLSKGVTAFRDGEAHERLKQYGPAIAQYDGARRHFLQAEEQSKQLMEEIQALKGAQGRMEEVRAHAELAEAQSFGTEPYEAAAVAEAAARKTAGLKEATALYGRAEELYSEALEAARAHGESVLVDPRKKIAALELRGEEIEIEEHAPEEVATVRGVVQAAEEALPDFARALVLYEGAVVQYEEVLKVAMDRKQLKIEQTSRSSIACAGIPFVWVPPGTFQMGAAEGSLDEKPVHMVMLESGFWLGTSPVTQGQWREVMGKNPSGFRGGDSLPVENVSWIDCQTFLKKLNALGEGVFRLPSEAEWEYACRAGSDGKWCFGDDASLLDGYAWHPENAGGRTHPVVEKLPNAWGLHDMHGNVSEWCLDHYHAGYDGAPASASAWLDETDREHVLRGGSWCMVTPDCHSAYRGWYAMADTRTDFMGFRVFREK